MQHKRFGFRLAAVVALALFASACSNTNSDTQGSSAPSGAPPVSTSAAGNDMHNDADVTFAQGMIPHHQQAIEMSDMLLAKQGLDPQIASLANQIKSAQGPEIEQMQGWLQAWGASPIPAATSSGMPGHNMPGGGDASQMPGMAGGGHGMMSEGDMAALQNAQGGDAGRLFLTQMIEHHKGAITMAQFEIDHGQFPAAVEMARTIVANQQEEITTMQAILEKQ